MTGATQSQISLEDIEVSYPQKGGGRKVVLDDLSLTISNGEFVTVVGPSGCGKSTVLRMILGSQLPRAGISMVSGNPVSHVTSDRGIVYQKYSLLPHVTVLDNIAIGLIFTGTNLPQRVLHTPGFFRMRKDARKKAQRYVQEIGLNTDDAEKFPHELSGGMRQRVAIAQALIMKPDVLLMDEPFGALDHSTREDMQAFILKEQELHGMTVLFVTHDLDEAIYLGTRLIAVSQYWSDENGQAGVGAKIVADVDLRKELPGEHPRPHNVKFTPEFQAIKKRIEREALDPTHLQHLRCFDDAHAAASPPVG